MDEAEYFGMVQHVKDHKLPLGTKLVPLKDKIILYFQTHGNYGKVQFLHLGIGRYHLTEHGNTQEHLKEKNNQQFKNFTMWHI